MERISFNHFNSKIVVIIKQYLASADEHESLCYFLHFATKLEKGSMKDSCSHKKVFVVLIMFVSSELFDNFYLGFYFFLFNRVFLSNCHYKKLTDI